MEAVINRDKKHKSLNVYAWYTIFFVVAALISFSFFIIYKKSFVWKNDGLYQHYNAFLYFGKNVREFIQNVFQNPTFEFPMWEWGLGPGNDAISYQLFYDPFFIFSVFTPTKFGEIGYGFTVVLRLYIAGFSFCSYCKEMKCLKWSTVFATIMYVFNAYMIFGAPRHPYFVNTTIYMPLIFLGIEKILNHKSFLLFSLAVALAALSDFYFFYMVVLLTIIYVALRLICDSKYRNIKAFSITVGKILVFSVIGVLISCVLLLPTIMSFVENNTRINDGYVSDIFYTLSQYSEYPGAILSSIRQPTGWAFVGMSALAYIGVFGSFIGKNKNNRWARIYFILEIVFLAFPIFGRMFNGFGYVTNRWVFIWSFVPSFLVARELPDILNFDIKKKGILTISVMTYTMMCLILDKSRTEDVLVGVVFLLISMIVVIFTNNIKDLIINKTGFKFFLSPKRINQFLIALLILT